MFEKVSLVGCGDGGGMDTANLERKLDQVNRNISRLASAMQDLRVEVDGETLGRVSSDSQTNKLADTSPLA